MKDIEWIIDLPASLTEELADSFQQGPMLANGLRRLDEQLAAHLNGLKIQIFANEHPPPHFRVSYAGETANYSIFDCSQLNGGLSKWHKNIKKWHAKNKGKLIEIWNSTRPSDCPVGEYSET